MQAIKWRQYFPLKYGNNLSLHGAKILKIFKFENTYYSITSHFQHPPTEQSSPEQESP